MYGATNGNLFFMFGDDGISRQHFLLKISLEILCDIQCTRGVKAHLANTEISSTESKVLPFFLFC